MSLSREYSGSIKLGTGGLVRVYTDTINKVLGVLETKLKEEKSISPLHISYAMEPLIRPLESLSIDFTAEHSESVAFRLIFTEAQKQSLSTELKEYNLDLTFA